MTTTTNGMVSFKGYVAGWLDSSIHDFLEHFPRTPKGMEYALVTALDSNLSPRSLLDRSPELQPLVDDVKPLADGILLRTARVLEVEATKPIFFGFDEVWFFPDDNIAPKPRSTWLVGPGRIDQRKMEELGSWLKENRCSLALGDGCGLNVIIKAKGLVRYLIGYSMLQPEPVAHGGEQIREQEAS